MVIGVVIGVFICLALYPSEHCAQFFAFVPS